MRDAADKVYDEIEFECVNDKETSQSYWVWRETGSTEQHTSDVPTCDVKCTEPAPLPEDKYRIWDGGVRCSFAIKRVESLMTSAG